MAHFWVRLNTPVPLVCGMSAYSGFKALEHAEDLAVECNRVADRFPRHEQDGLANQLRRAAASVALNLAEGSARSSYKDYRRFLDGAWSSLREIQITLRIARRSGYITEEEYCRVEAIRDETARTVYGVLRAVSRRIEEGETRRKL